MDCSQSELTIRRSQKILNRLTYVHKILGAHVHERSGALPNLISAVTSGACPPCPIDQHLLNSTLCICVASKTSHIPEKVQSL